MTRLANHRRHSVVDVVVVVVVVEIGGSNTILNTRPSNDHSVKLRIAGFLIMYYSVNYIIVRFLSSQSRE